MSEETKWTPGPWRVFTPEDYSGPSELPGLGVEAENGEAVVWYCDEPETGLGNDADAHLISAAPELYGALEWAMRFVDQVRAESTAPEGGGEDIAYREARAALAQARGETS